MLHILLIIHITSLRTFIQSQYFSNSFLINLKTVIYFFQKRHELGYFIYSTGNLLFTVMPFSHCITQTQNIYSTWALVVRWKFFVFESSLLRPMAAERVAEWSSIFSLSHSTAHCQRAWVLVRWSRATGHLADSATTSLMHWYARLLSQSLFEPTMSMGYIALS